MVSSIDNIAKYPLLSSLISDLDMTKVPPQIQQLIKEIHAPTGDVKYSQDLIPLVTITLMIRHIQGPKAPKAPLDMKGQDAVIAMFVQININ